MAEHLVESHTPNPKAEPEAVLATNDSKQPSPQEQFQGHLGSILSGAMTANLIALGDSLGIYSTMKKQGKASSNDLAVAAGLNERFLREFLYQQASAKVISTNDDASQFWLSEIQANCLANEYGKDASPFFMGGLFQHVPELLAHNKRLGQAFTSGVGFTYDDMGADNICSTCRSLGVWVRHFLVKRLCTLPGMEQKLREGITVADVGCGAGELLFTLAEAFPKGKYHGYDISAKSVQAAKARKEKDAKDLHISFFNPDEGENLPNEPTYDLIITMDAVHDMARPDKVLSLVRKALKPDGSYLINDPKGAPTPADNIKSNRMASMFYGFSCHACLPSGTSEPGGMGLGTLGFQEPQAHKMAADAGFSGFQVVTTFDSPMNNVFLLKP